MTDHYGSSRIKKSHVRTNNNIVLISRQTRILEILFAKKAVVVLLPVVSSPALPCDRTFPVLSKEAASVRLADCQAETSWLASGEEVKRGRFAYEREEVKRGRFAYEREEVKRGRFTYEWER